GPHQRQRCRGLFACDGQESRPVLRLRPRFHARSARLVLQIAARPPVTSAGASPRSGEQHYPPGPPNGLPGTQNQPKDHCPKGPRGNLTRFTFHSSRFITMIPNPFATTAPLIAASILSADFSRLDREMAEVDAGGADFWHLDVMDGHFVRNISFGPHFVESIRPLTDVFFDAHLMISDPLRYAPAFVKAGANSLTFHVETVTNPVATAKQIRELGCEVGITLN